MTSPPEEPTDPTEPTEPIEPDEPTRPYGWASPSTSPPPSASDPWGRFPPPPGYVPPAPAPAYAAGPPGPGPVGPVTNQKAVWALTVGVLSLVLSCCCLGYVGVAGIVLGVVARQEIARSGGRETGDGLALAGIVVGSVAVALAVAGSVFSLLPLVPALFGL